MTQFSSSWLNVSPYAVSRYSLNNFAWKIQRPHDLALPLAFHQHCSDGQHVRVVQRATFCSPVIRAAWHCFRMFACWSKHKPIAATFAHRVVEIVSDRAKKQMTRITAWRVVATVADLTVVNNGPSLVSQKPRYYVRSHVFAPSMDVERSVSKRKPSSSPVPALVMATLVDFGPEPLSGNWVNVHSYSIA